jgi:chemotaxis regulatin CheY-phosphate phosphatase CheZ
MFSNLSQNSILYILDLRSNPKVLSGPIERISIPRPKYNTFNPNMEMVVDIIANINGERREFKGVPNNTIADFGEDAFVLAESKDVLNSYVHSMLQNSKNIINSIEKHQTLISQYEEAIQELNPDIKASMENDKAIKDLKDEISELKQMIASMAKSEQPKTT